jgi:rubredoxin
MFLWLFVYRFRNFPLGMQLLVCCLPSVGLMGMQFLSAFYGTTNSDSAGVVIAPFKVAGLYTPNIAISTLLVLAFPLLLALCSIARRVFDWTDAFAWLMLLAGMAEKFLLVADVEKRHEERYNQVLNHLKEGATFESNEEGTLWKCRNCGAIFEGKEPPEVCPVCAHPKAYFERRAENY